LHPHFTSVIYRCPLYEPLSEEIIKQMHHSLKEGVFQDIANRAPCNVLAMLNKLGKKTAFKGWKPGILSGYMCRGSRISAAEYNRYDRSRRYVLR